MGLIQGGAFALLILLILKLSQSAQGQVCSPFGGLCEKTTDCCPGGCCEGNTCVNRGFSCSGDMPRSNGPGCQTHFCPKYHICYMLEICDYLNPCPAQPRCKHIPRPPYNFTVDYSSANSHFGGTWCTIFGSILFFALSKLI